MFNSIPIRFATTSRAPHSERLRLTACLLLVWSLLYALAHLYWGLGGPEGHSVYKPSASEMDGWEAAHLFAFALIAFAGTLGFALERTGDSARWRVVPLVVVGAGAAIAASHGLYGIAFRAASVLGITNVEGIPFDTSQHGWVLWDLFAIEPWFLIEGVLLGLVGYFALVSARGRRTYVVLVSATFSFFLLTAVLSVKVA